MTSDDAAKKRKIEAHVVESKILSEDRTVKVFVPPNYDPKRRYPVMYCHDGLEFFTHGRVATIAAERIAAGALKPMLIAGIEVSKTRRNDDYAMIGNRHEEYCRFVVEEAIPSVVERYSVDEQNVWMAGISLGATVTLSLALREPEMFRNLLLFSGAYYKHVQERIREEGDLSQILAYMVVGRQETEVETHSNGTRDFYTYNQQMRDLLRVRGADIDYHEADGTHIWGFWQKQLPDALAFVNNQLK